MENFQFLAKKSWYKQWWGATIIVVVCIFFAFIIALALLTWRYHNLIKLGYEDELKRMIYGQTQQDEQNLATRAELEITERPFLGNKEAEVVIVAFIDFNCPVCKEQNTILQKVIGKYGNKIKLIWRNFPMESLYKGSTRLSQMAYCSHEQGLYWPAHNYFYDNQGNLPENITSVEMNNFTKEIGLDSKVFNACLLADKTKIESNRDFSIGYKYGVAGTPTFFLNGYRIPGNVPFEVWEDLIKKILNP